MILSYELPWKFSDCSPIVAYNNYDGFLYPHVFLKIQFSILKII
jgi:hypothetical protein